MISLMGHLTQPRHPSLRRELDKRFSLNEQEVFVFPSRWSVIANVTLEQERAAALLKAADAEGMR